MKVIQIEEKRFKELFDSACTDLHLDKCLNADNHYNSDAEYKSALNGMHRRFVHVIQRLQGSLEKS
ncbi:hypothetical protein LCGC14_0855660 [marine sediment metagenome]|uniref:Uncharacterized protein n=1 Tax=marine sediment metagenome TaxID=412755 RepID=A0A0F9RTM6_9ZZZZ